LAERLDEAADQARMGNGPAGHRDRLGAVELEALRLVALPGEELGQTDAGSPDDIHASTWVVSCHGRCHGRHGQMTPGPMARRTKAKPSARRNQRTP
jgi:cytochrome c553